VNNDTTAAAFLARLEQLRGTTSARPGPESGTAKVPMRELFALAKTFIDTPCAEIEKLLKQPEHDTRVGAVSIMDWQARRRTTNDETDMPADPPFRTAVLERVEFRLAGRHAELQRPSDEELHPLREVPRWTWTGDEEPA
jgi:hypothetical protein